MKKSLILLLICFLGTSIYSYCQKLPLDGKSYSLQMMDENKPDKREKGILHFIKGKIDAEQFRQYGFKPAPYSADEMASGAIGLDAICTSSKEGTLNWSAKIKGDLIGGSVVWKKNDHSVVTYKFKGLAIKK